MQNIVKRLMVWAVIIVLILMIPLAAMLFTDEVNWSLFDFVLMGAFMFGVGLAYELVARKSEKTVYRVAFGVGLAGAFLLFWVNGAVGIIGDNQLVNMMYGAVFAVGIIGSIAARFKPRGMALTLFAAAFTQMLIPLIALIIWPSPIISWAPGVFGVFVLNAFFAMLFVVSALLFRLSSAHHNSIGTI